MPESECCNRNVVLAHRRNQMTGWWRHWWVYQQHHLTHWRCYLKLFRFTADFIIIKKVVRLNFLWLGPMSLKGMTNVSAWQRSYLYFKKPNQTQNDSNQCQYGQHTQQHDVIADEFDSKRNGCGYWQTIAFHHEVVEHFAGTDGPSPNLTCPFVQLFQVRRTCRCLGFANCNFKSRI